MFGRYKNIAGSLFVPTASVIFSLSLVGVAAAQSNTSLGQGALVSNTTGSNNTALGADALFFNTTGSYNTASGVNALLSNTTGSLNTAGGVQALFSNTTGNNNTATGVISVSQADLKTKKENFRPVDGEEVLRKIRGFELTSWNFIGHDPKEFRHYGPMAQDFFAAFGHDGVGQIGTETTINSGDMAGILMIAVQALEKRTVQISVLESELKQKDVQIAALAARLEALELRQNQPIQITAEQQGY